MLINGRMILRFEFYIKTPRSVEASGCRAFELNDKKCANLKSNFKFAQKNILSVFVVWQEKKM